MPCILVPISGAQTTVTRHFGRAYSVDAVPRRKHDRDIRARTLSRTNFESTALQFDQCLGDRQSKSGSLAPARTAAVDLTERGHCDFDFFGAHAEAAVATEDDKRAGAGAPGFDSGDAVPRGGGG